MSIRRYNRDPVLGFGTRYGTSRAINIIRNGIANGSIRTSTQLLGEAMRLDNLAGQIYGDATLWWILAAASDIGWAMQLPTNTVIVVPDLVDVGKLLG